MRLSKLSIRQLQARPGRAILTLTSVVIGVAAVASVSLAIGTTRVAYRQMFEALTGRAALEVVAAGSGTFAQNLVSKLEQVPGVKVAAPMIQRGTIVYFSGRKAKVMVLGVDPTKDRQLRDYEIQAGHFLAGGDDVLLDANFSAGLNIKVGDPIKILTHRGVRKLTVTGLLAPAGVASFVQGASLFVPLESAQRLFGRTGQIDSIQLVLTRGVSSDTMLVEVSRRLPAGVIVRIPATRTELADATLISVEQGLHMAATLSLVLAIFIILNTFLMSITERRPQMAMMRAVGATRSQIIRLLLREGIGLGVVGTVLGLAAGIGGAYLLTRAMSQFLQTSLPAVSLSFGPLVLSSLLGIGLSLLAVLIPALLAGRISPLEGLQARGGDDLRRLPRHFALTGLSMVIVSSGLLLACLAGKAPLQFAVYAGAGVLIGMVLLVPISLDPLSKLAAWLPFKLAPAEARLARRRMLRHPIRTMLTVGVLFIALATGIGLGTAIVNNIQDVQNWIDRTLVADFFVRAMMPDMATGLAADIPERVAPEIHAIAGIAHVSAVRRMSARAAGLPVIVLAKQFAGEDRLPLDLRVGNYEEVARRVRQGEVVIGTLLSQKAHLTVGDKIGLETTEGLKRFAIAGITNEYTAGGMIIVIDRSVAERLLGITGADAYLIKVKPHQEAVVAAALRKICEENGLILQSAAQLRALVDSMMAGIVGCLWALLVLAFMVAAFGIVNTLTMNVLEQTREIALLRVVAMTRWQIRKTILCEAAIMGLIGLVPGALIGAGLALVMDYGNSLDMGHLVEFHLQPELLAGSFLVAYAMVIAAAWAPAERAARLELLSALHYE